MTDPRDRQAPSPPELLHEIVAGFARARPDDVAVVYDRQRLTFGELHERIEHLAGTLDAFGSPGDRVAIVAPNLPAWIECYYAVPRARRVLAFVNHRLAPEQIFAAIRRVRPVLVLAGDTELAAVEQAHPGASRELAPVLALGPAGTYDTLFATPADAPRATGAPADTAWLIATSGTSGTPKNVQLSHANLLAAVRITAATRPTAPDDVYLFPFPLCHVAGYNALQFHFHGRPVVVMARFDAQAFIDLTNEHGVTTTSLAPTMIHALVDLLESSGQQVPSLRSISYGSGPIAPSLLRRGLGLLDVDFQQGYGMTELAGNAAFLGGDEHRRGAAGATELLHSAGRPGPGVELRILDDDARPVASGEPGEIAVRSGQVMKGYWEAPAANEASFVDGWFRTGDIGRIDEHGYLFVIDRKKDIIITGGENVSSREVEDLLVLHPDIREAAVVGVPDERWGEAVCAVVVPRPGASIGADDIVRYGRDTVGGFKKPRHALVVDALPRNASGKVLKRELRTLAADRLGR